MKILFVGNSITIHAPKEEIGWLGNHGMAASCEENDYVHRLCSMLVADGITVEKAVASAVALEMMPYSFDVVSLAALRDFGADVIIVRLGENTNINTLAAFGKKLRQVIAYLKNGSAAKVLCVGSFWDNEQANKIIEEVAGQENAVYVSLDSLHDEKYRAVGLFEHAGVASHPSDAGMEAIARIIYSHM